MIAHFLGIDPFIWFIGVVENRDDPEKLGRIQVRIFGHHTENKEDIPTDELHWAWVIHPVTSAGINGIGDFPVGVVEGSWVVGFFKDSENCQEPIIFGVIGGASKGDYPYPKNQKTGFLDPGTNLSDRPRKIKERKYKNDGTPVEITEETRSVASELYPRKQNPLGNILGENDLNRLARNENIDDTIIYIKKNNLNKVVKIADGSNWSEPATKYNAKYPFNKVTETESGHIVEFDDTKDYERIHFWHRTGSFFEYYPNGAKVEKIVHNSYSIVMAEKYEHVMNRYNLTVDGPYNLMVYNPANITITGNCTIKVGGTAKIQASEMNLEGNNVRIKATNTITLQSGQKIELKSMNVTSNPAISQAKESLKTSGIGRVTPALPMPDYPDIDVETETKSRTYPVPMEDQ